MVAKNDITGDSIRSKSLSDKGRDNWDRIFGGKNDKVEEETKTDDSRAETSGRRETSESTSG